MTAGRARGRIRIDTSLTLDYTQATVVEADLRHVSVPGTVGEAHNEAWS
jgi:hypothetical protein